MSRFQLSGLSHEPFQPLFELSDEELGALGAARVEADAGFGFPCRVSLQDAEVGETLLLLSHEHQPAASPYRASGPIFIRRDARQRVLPAGVVPPYVTQRLMSLRAYDATHRMVDAAVCEGTAVAAWLEQAFSDTQIAYIHLHNAKRGCFSCMAARAAATSACTMGNAA